MTAKIIRKIAYLLAALAMLGLAASCQPDDSSPGYGSIHVQVIWGTGEGAAVQGGGFTTLNHPPSVVTIRATVIADAQSIGPMDFNADDHSGSIGNIPAGTNRTLIMQGLDDTLPTPNIIYTGTETNIEVFANDLPAPASRSVTLLPTDPAPGNVSSFADVAGDGEVALSWINPSDPDFAGVMIRRSTSTISSYTDGTQIYDAAGTGFTDTSVTNDTTYYFKAFAYDTVGIYSSGVEVSATPTAAATSAPTGVAAAAGDTQVTISWNAVVGADSYNLYYSTTAGVTTADSKFAGVTSSYLHSPLINGTTYYYMVTAVAGGVESAASSEVSATPNEPPPSAPTGVAAAPGDLKNTISWSAVTGATSYNIYWSTTPGVDTLDSKIAGVTSPYDHTGRANGTTYYYIVTAENAGGESGPSSEVSATPEAPVAGIPSGVAAAPGDGQVTISWIGVAGATSYNLYWSTTSTVTIVGSNKIAGVTSPYNHTGRANGTTYYYAVTAVNPGGESALSSEVNATPQVDPPSAPTVVSATPADAEVTVSWGTVIDAASYNLYWSTTTPVTILGSNKVAGATSPILHSSFSPVVNGTTYYYAVTAVNPGGESGLSSEVEATPQVDPPSSPTGVSAVAGNGQVTISWGAVSGATSYNIYWNTISGVTTAHTPIMGITSPHLHSPLTNGTTYYYIVTAQNDGGESAPSTEVNATPVDPPGTPTGFAAVGGDKSVTHSWTVVAGVTSYNIYWGTASGVNTGSPKLANVGSPNLQSGLTNDTTYFYVITAENAGGESAASTEISATPEPPSKWDEMNWDYGRWK